MNVEDVELTFPLGHAALDSEIENWDIYWFTLTLTNDDFLCKVFEEYLIYDSIGMIGSVGGTLGKYVILFLNLYIME